MINVKTSYILLICFDNNSNGINSCNILFSCISLLKLLMDLLIDHALHDRTQPEIKYKPRRHIFSSNA